MRTKPYNVPEAAKILGYSEVHVRRLLNPNVKTSENMKGQKLYNQRIWIIPVKEMKYWAAKRGVDLDVR